VEEIQEFYKERLLSSLREAFILEWRALSRLIDVKLIFCPIFSSNHPQQSRLLVGKSQRLPHKHHFICLVAAVVVVVMDGEEEDGK